MKIIQKSKANHQSKNDVTIVVDMDVALLNADKNTTTIKKYSKNTKNQANIFINARKKMKIYEIKHSK